MGRVISVLLSLKPQSFSQYTFYPWQVYSVTLVLCTWLNVEINYPHNFFLNSEESTSQKKLWLCCKSSSSMCPFIVLILKLSLWIQKEIHQYSPFTVIIWASLQALTWLRSTTCSIPPVPKEPCIPLLLCRLPHLQNNKKLLMSVRSPFKNGVQFDTGCIWVMGIGW